MTPLDWAASITTGEPTEAAVNYYEGCVIASQLRASPAPTGLVHYAAGWNRGGIHYTGCGLRLVHGVTVAGVLGNRAETTCVACLAAMGVRR